MPLHFKRKRPAGNAQSVLCHAKKGLPKQALSKAGLPSGRLLVVGAATAKAVPAIDRFISARLERNFRDAPALAAGCLEHLASGASSAAAAAAAVRRTSGLASRAAFRATAGLIGKALHREELLLAAGKRELRSAVNAGKHFVCIHL
jgi:hypothetical protein